MSKYPRTGANEIVLDNFTEDFTELTKRGVGIAFDLIYYMCIYFFVTDSTLQTHGRVKPLICHFSTRFQ